MSTKTQKNFSTAQVRAAFLDYFASKDHEIIASCSLVPADDPTLLFTNAGMVQFKDVFLGVDNRNYHTAASSQRCVRAGGKHNDLENVGYTARHHTFFEMLGNFSFGDYFKHDAIAYAWEFLTNVIGLPAEKLWVTVYEKDDEAADIWLKEIKVSPQRFSRIGEKDNFWSMGDVGPCGPCSEIFYDHGEEIAGGPPGSPDEDGDRYIEIWNLVFMQYDRKKDGSLVELPKPSVDTGMGLERLTAILQHAHNNYDIDLFQHLIKAVAKIANCNDLSNKSLRVISDHIRACSFLIVDGVIPSNEGRGYVLRRIIRRAIRHGHKLGIDEKFFYRLVQDLAFVMGDAYPELNKQQAHIERILSQEEESFAETLSQGMDILEAEIAELDGKVISGEIAFKLYGTYGFPFDLTADIARERGLQLDQQGFEEKMQEERVRARSSGGFAAKDAQQLVFSKDTQLNTNFVGYDELSATEIILDIFVNNEKVANISAGQQAIIVLNSTPFYAESGGQVGDKGFIKTQDAIFEVTDTQKMGSTFLHYGRLIQGKLSQQQSTNVTVDQQQRQQIKANHSATHLLHAALRQILGEHVQQKGSLVDHQKLRFDFSHYEAISEKQLDDIEQLVNKQIRINHPVNTQVMSIDKAKESGAMALFGEKYSDEVRVLSMGEFSIELCGGTHVNQTGEIGLLKIISEAGVAAGVRRIEAVSSQNALDYVKKTEQAINAMARALKIPRDNLEKKIESLLEHNKELEKECERLKSKLASNQGGSLIEQAVEIAGIKVLSVKLDGINAKNLRETLDQLKNKLGSCIVLLASVENNKVNLIAGVSKDLVSRIKAADVVNQVATQVGGKGGGRPDMAMAGGNQPENIDTALASLKPWLEKTL